MKDLINLYKEKSKIVEDSIKDKDGLIWAVMSIKAELVKDLILALETVNNELEDIKRDLEIKTQTFYYFACSRCGKTVLETDNPYPDAVCTHPNDYNKGLCGGKFDKRLTKEEYLDYFDKKPLNDEQ